MDEEGEEDSDDDVMDVEEGNEESEEEQKAPTLTSEILRRWQKALLEVYFCTKQIESNHSTAYSTAPCVH